MKRIKQLLLAAILLVGVSLTAVPSTVGAVDVLQACTNGAASANVGDDDYSAVCASKDKDSASSFITIIVNTLLYVIGAISVIMLIFGGIRYATSAGVANNITAAKNTIMYALIGLVVAFLAYAIVNWVLKQL